jgi:hypothetical protein
MKERADQEMNRTASVSAAELPTLQFSVGIGCIHYCILQISWAYRTGSPLEVCLTRLIGVLEPWLRMPLSLIKVIKLQHSKEYESNMDSPVLDNNKSFRCH